MSLTNSMESKIARHLFLNEAIALIGDATGLPASAAAGVYYVHLWTTDPTETGTAGAAANYTGYVPVSVARSGAGFTESGGVVSNAAAVTFPDCTAGDDTITHYTVETSATAGAGTVLGSGTTGTVVVNTTSTPPSFAIGALTVSFN